MKKSISIVFFSIFLIFSSVSLLFFLKPYFIEKYFPNEYWIVISIGFFILSFLFAIFLHPKKKIKEKMDSKDTDEKYNEINASLTEMIKAHLKVSILFWIHFYKKEKVKSLDETKKIIFRNLKKEFNHIPGMEKMLMEIYKQFSNKGEK